MKETTRTRSSGAATGSKSRSAPAAPLQDLPRRVVRYWCFRFATEAAGGATAADAPEGLKEHFEALRWFPGWLTFAVKWDVAAADPLDIRPLRRSLEAAWDDVVKAEAKEIPV